MESTRSVVTGTLVVLSLLSAGLAGCSSHKPDANDGVIKESFHFASPGGKLVITYPPGSRAPIGNVTGPSLRDQSKTLSLSDYDGKVVVLSAWGQWCGPCRTEVDDLQRIYDAIRDKGGTVLGIDVRDYSPQIAKDFLVANGATYPSIWDPPFKSAGALGGLPASVIPTTIVLDKKHRPAAVFLREITDKEILDVVKPLLAEKD